MRTGRRIADPARKALAGTYRADRHGDIVELVTPPRDIPVAPDYLTKEAKRVWEEELPRILACGGVEADSSFLARYCTAEAEFRGMAAKGEPVTAAMMTALRQYAELLGIAGHRSRLARGNSQDKPTSGFSKRPV